MFTKTRALSLLGAAIASTVSYSGYGAEGDGLIEEIIVSA